MISIDRKLRLKDLEIFRFLKDNVVLAYIIIEDTRKPYTEE
ncbi:terpene synthase, partial [Sporosarcina sp. P31]